MTILQFIEVQQYRIHNVVQRAVDKKYNYLECMVRYFFILIYGIRGNLWIDQNNQEIFLYLVG